MVTVRVKKEDKVGQTLWCNYFVIDKLLNQMFVVSLQSYLADMASKQQNTQLTVSQWHLANHVVMSQ